MAHFYFLDNSAPHLFQRPTQDGETYGEEDFTVDGRCLNQILPDGRNISRVIETRQPFLGDVGVIVITAGIDKSSGRQLYRKGFGIFGGTDPDNPKTINLLSTTPVPEHGHVIPIPASEFDRMYVATTLKHSSFRKIYQELVGNK